MKTPQVPAMPGMSPLGIKPKARKPRVTVEVQPIMVTQLTGLVGRWSTRGGKYWLELIQNADGSYSYRHESGGGYMGQLSLDEAFRRMGEELQSYASDGHHLKQV